MSGRRGRLAVALVACLVLVAACTTEMTASPAPEPKPTETPAASPSPSSSPTPTPLVEGCPGRDTTPGQVGRGLDPQRSRNWSGYVIYDRGGDLRCVEGSWLHPDVTCPTRGEADVAVWVGIDGIADSANGIDAGATLVQIGTNAGCESGRPRDFAWYQVIPQDELSVHIPGLEVAAGDEMRALVQWADGVFTLQLVDATTGQSFVVERALDGAARQTAEWIVEAPTIGCPSDCHVASLPDFVVVMVSETTAALAGRLGTISDDGWTHARIDLVKEGGVLSASTSGLGSDGTSFTVTWHHE